MTDLVKHPKEIKDFDEILSGKKLVVVDFYASWCVPCQYLAPVFSEYSNLYKDATFVKLDVDDKKFFPLMKKYKVSAMPTIKFFHGGKNIDTLVGVNPFKLKSLILKYCPHCEKSKVLHPKTKEDYEKIVKEANDKLIAIDFFASWCNPCKYIAPYFAQLSTKYLGVIFVKLDVGDKEFFSVMKEMKVKAMPTFKFVKKGSVIDELVGADPKELEKKIQKNK